MSKMEGESVVAGIINECISKVGHNSHLTANPSLSQSDKDCPSGEAVLASSTSQHSSRPGSSIGLLNPSTSANSQSSKAKLKSSDSDKSVSASVYSLLATKSSDPKRSTSHKTAPGPQEQATPSPNIDSVLYSQSIPRTNIVSVLPSQSNPSTNIVSVPPFQSFPSTNIVSVLPSQSFPSTNIVSVLSAQSQCPPSLLVSCDVCTKPCQRAVSLPCCQSQACRACAVKFITSHRVCWGCGEEAATLHIKIEVALREAVKTVASKGALEEALRIELEGRKKAREKLAKKRKDLGLVVTIRGGTESSSRSVIEISEANRFKQDQSEMDDIEDKRWKPLRETRTDKERVLLAKKMFGNAVNSDPNRNLSFHGYRSGLALKREKPYRKHLQPSSFEIKQGNLNPLPGFKKVKRNMEDRSFKSNSDLGFTEEDVQIRDIPDVMKDVYLKQLQDRYSKRYMKEDFKELKRFVGHYVSGFKETSDFFSFYNLGETEKKVSRERLEEMVDIEKLLGEFAKHYGDIEQIFCKECKVEHRF